jgi:hypothetical protein
MGFVDANGSKGESEMDMVCSRLAVLLGVWLVWGS